MYDEKEIEELYDEFLGLDGDMFLESDVDVKKLGNGAVTADFDLSTTKIPSNFKNNNFLSDTGGIRVDKPDVSIQLDLLNQNFISLNTCEFEKSKSLTGVPDLRSTGRTPVRPTVLLDRKLDEVDNELKEIDEKLSSPISPVEKHTFHRVGWTSDALGLWHSGPSSLNLNQTSHNNVPHQDLSTSVTYISHGPQSLGGFSSSAKRTYSHQQLGAKVEMVYSLLSMLDTDNREDMSKTFLAMSSSPESCHAMRQSGCLPLLIQLIYSSELDRDVRNRAAEALHNVVHAQTDEKRRKREVRVLKLLQQVREYCDDLKNYFPQTQSQESDKHPINATGTLMKLSFDAEHRQAICVLGGLHAITDLIQVDHKVHGSTNEDALCITMRRYSGMSLTNLTFGDGKNKALLCSFSKFLLALVDQLKSPSEDLRQVTASVLRNLSWRADSESKQALRQVGAVTALTISAMEAKKESTLKSILSALWNLSAHCSLNKIDICSVPGALAFLVKMLKYKSVSNTLSIIENAGGILRNISSHIAVREDYRQILRDNCCFEVLLEQLKSPSLTIVSNACGTLWNLSARCTEDQKRLWEMGATTMLRSLVQSKHKMISMGSSAALKNLLAANPNENLLTHLDSTAKSLGLQNLPTLFVRKKRALEQELNITLAETCENIEPVASFPSHINKPEGQKEEKGIDGPKRSDSHDSVKSSKSDTVYELLNHISHLKEDKVLDNSNTTLHSSLDEKFMNPKIEDQKLIKRYATSMIPMPTSKKMNQDRINEKTKEEKLVFDNSSGIVTDTENKEQKRVDLKQRNKKGIPVLKNKPKRTVFQEDTPLERCSPVKLHEGPLPNEEVESLDNENIILLPENHHDSADSVSNSHKKSQSSNIYCKKNVWEESDSVNEIERIAATHEECKRNETNKEEQEDELHSKKKEIPGESMFTRCEVESLNKNSCVKIDAVHRKTDPALFDDNFNVTPNNVDVIGDSSCENEILSQDVSKNAPRSSVSDGSEFERTYEKVLTTRCIENKSEVKEDAPPNENVSKAPENLPQESSTIRTSQFSDLCPKKILKEKSEDFGNGKENQSGFECQNESHGDQLDFNENYPREFKLFDQKLGCESHEEQQAVPKEWENAKKTFFSASSDTDAGSSFAYASPAANDSDNSREDVKIADSSESSRTEGVFKSSVLPFNAENVTVIPGNVNVDEIGLKASSAACIVPKFKVGSPITDARILQMEAKKICREIQKEHDFEMGCSLTSEVSLVSCSSFLDTGDYSLFDCSTDTMNFDESEIIRAGPKTKNHLFPKSASLAAESVSLPSLGSLKNEQIEALDLDNSVLSVASITSEIDEYYAKDNARSGSCTGTYKIDEHEDLPEETSADATLVSKADDTLNAEIFDDDNSLHSQENLPLDVDTFHDEFPHRVRTRLTPKEKRKTFHERYRTYTIRDFKICDRTGSAPNAGNEEIIDDEELVKEDEVQRDGITFSRVKNTCNQYDLAWDAEYNKENLNRKPHGQDSSSGILYRGRGHEIFQFSKSFDKERDYTPGFVFDSRSLNDLLSLGPSERKELADNAKLVAFSLKTAVQDWETEFISDSETEEPHKSSDIDTATYTKNFRDRAHSRLSLQEFQVLKGFKDAEPPENSEKFGAKITKPSEKAENETSEELTKGIRGRRKPLYVSPQKSPLRVKGFSSTPKVAPAVVDAKKPSSQQTCQSPQLHREGTFTKEDGSVSKTVEGKNPGTTSVPSRNVETKNGTRLPAKNKCAPSAGNSKAVGESRVSRIGRPLSTYASRANEKRIEADSSQRRPFSAGAGNRTSGENAATAKKPASTSSASQRMRNSSSSQSMKAGNNSGNGCPVKNRNLNSQCGKSQSDASLNLVDAKDKVSLGKGKNSKKEVTSKIATLWRKVEETKEKNKNLKDTRVWIGPEQSKTSSEALVMEKEEIVHIPTRTIVHSFTCQALTDGISNDYSSLERNTQDISHNGVMEERRVKTQKRNIISAVVPPYNYNPPVPVVTPSSFKEVDDFQKSSLKVTTV